MHVHIFINQLLIWIVMFEIVLLFELHSYSFLCVHTGFLNSSKEYFFIIIIIVWLGQTG